MLSSGSVTFINVLKAWAKAIGEKREVMTGRMVTESGRGMKKEGMKSMNKQRDVT